MSAEDKVFKDLSKEAVQKMKELEGKNPPDRIEDLSSRTVKAVEDVFEKHYAQYRQAEKEEERAKAW